jgi:hypothetical protein
MAGDDIFDRCGNFRLAEQNSALVCGMWSGVR